MFCLFGTDSSCSKIANASKLRLIEECGREVSCAAGIVDQIGRQRLTSKCLGKLAETLYFQKLAAGVVRRRSSRLTKNTRADVEETDSRLVKERALSLPHRPRKLCFAFEVREHVYGAFFPVSSIFEELLLSAFAVGCALKI